MRTRFPVILAGMLVLWAACWLFKAKAPIGSPRGETELSSALSQSPGATSTAANVSAPSRISAKSSSLANTDPKVAKMEAMIADENAKPLDFYGKVIDQFNVPIPQVKVKAGVGLIVDFSHSGGKEYYAETDGSGRFRFIGIHGAGMGPFVLVKEGYFYDQRLPSSSRSIDYVPDSNNPAIFHMWKLKGAEPMIKARIHAYIPCDGAPTLFDLTTGKKVATGGDLSVRLIRDPVDIVRGKPFTWRLSLEIPEGGLLEVADLYPNEAPVGGYQSIVTESMSADEKRWSPDLKKTYYFEAEKGHDFGRITVDLTGDFQPPPTSFDADIYLNPSGSRNLEYDRSKEIPAKH